MRMRGGREAPAAAPQGAMRDEGREGGAIARVTAV